MRFRAVIRGIASAGAILICAALLGALAGGALAGRVGAELGLIVGAFVGLALGFRYNADMAEVAAAQQHLQQRHSSHDRHDRSKGAASTAYLRDRTGEVWRALAAKRRDRLIGASPHARYTSQRHHDLELADIGIRRKRKPKR